MGRTCARQTVTTMGRTFPSGPFAHQTSPRSGIEKQHLSPRIVISPRAEPGLLQGQGRCEFFGVLGKFRVSGFVLNLSLSHDQLVDGRPDGLGAPLRAEGSGHPASPDTDFARFAGVAWVNPLTNR